jgi:hypothetical protein
MLLRASQIVGAIVAEPYEIVNRSHQPSALSFQHQTSLHDDHIMTKSRWLTANG